MSHSIPTGYIPPPGNPGEIFLSEQIPATRANFFVYFPALGQKMVVEFPKVGQNFCILEEITH